ncbi:THO complex subunit 6 homolog [Styela clava]
MDSRHLLCTTVYSTVFSPCGKFVAAANNFGHISLFNFEKAVTLNSLKWQKSIITFKAHDGPIHSLVSTKDCLLSGGVGPVAAWKWNDILERKPAKVYTLHEPSQGDEGSFSSNDVNVLACDETKLYAGRDDNVVCIWDFNSGKCERMLIGHTEYIHDIAIISPNGLVSASEDGSVKVWDLRMAQATTTIEPHQNKELSRPQYGKWISSVATDDNGQWMVCGGGPKLSLWHLRSQSQTAVLDCPEFTPYTTVFHENFIVSGGNTNSVHHWYTNGDEKASIPCGIGTVFSLTFNKKKNTDSAPLIAAGTSHKLDVFCNPSYRSHTLNL